MTLLHTVILSIVEGLTEFLPISSTGHLILAADVLHIAQTDVQKTFEIAIQLGAILAVVVWYGKTLLTDRRTFLLTCVAFIPTAVIGFLLHGVIKNLLLGNVAVVLWSLGIGGVVLMVFEKLLPHSTSVREVKRISFIHAFLIGVFQSVALIPGVSRSAATIIGGEMLGIERRAIVEFSFLLAIPTMVAATGYDLLKSASLFTSADVMTLVIGIALSFLVALVAIKWFLQYVQRHSLAVFGVYRVALAVVFALYLWVR